MRILVGWDDAAQAELIALYLGISDNEVHATADNVELLAAVAGPEPWDVVLLSTRLPGEDEAFDIFRKVRTFRPECPILGACGVHDVYKMARYMTAGMRSYVLRDDGADFVFLLQATLDNIVAAVRAEREQKISERLREEIDSVRKLQESIIPQDIQAPPGYEICARYESSEMRVLGGQPVLMAGGDYYDVFSIDDNSIVVLVGDASGHGMKACMSIMTMHTLVRMIRDLAYQAPAAFVAEVNRRLCQQSIVQNEGGFITLFYGVLRIDTQEFQWASAGHPAPLLFRGDTGEVLPIADGECGGLPLAIVPDAEYETYTTHIPPNSRLLMYTDGLIEAFPECAEEHEEFGLKGVAATLQRTAQQTLPEVLNALFKDSNAFTQGAGRHDDTSVVLVERR